MKKQTKTVLMVGGAAVLAYVIYKALKPKPTTDSNTPAFLGSKTGKKATSSGCKCPDSCYEIPGNLCRCPNPYGPPTDIPCIRTSPKNVTYRTGK